MSNHVANRVNTPLNVFSKTGKAQKNGPLGFDAAMLPLLEIHNEIQAKTALEQQLMVDTTFTKNRYYDSVLYLFSLSTINGLYEIDTLGKLEPNWSNKCH